MATGRPPMYRDELADTVLMRLAEGESLSSIARDQGMPSRRTVHGWIDNDLNGFAAKYARAREEQAHALLDEILDTARTVEAADIGRMRVDALKWAASKILPKAYGDRSSIEVTVGPDLATRIEEGRKRVRDE